MTSSAEPIEHVILVDDADCEIGQAEKLAAHRAGQLHRAFSVMIFDTSGRMLLQQRQRGKYHSGGLWTNACCGHPRPGESVSDAAHRRLMEEMGFVTGLVDFGTFTYRAELDDGLIEHELVHLFRGNYDGPIVANPNECDGYTWIAHDDLAQRLSADPARFTAWFRKYAEAEWPLANT